MWRTGFGTGCGIVVRCAKPWNEWTCGHEMLLQYRLTCSESNCEPQHPTVYRLNPQNDYTKCPQKFLNTSLVLSSNVLYIVHPWQFRRAKPQKSIHTCVTCHRTTPYDISFWDLFVRYQIRTPVSILAIVTEVCCGCFQLLHSYVCMLAQSDQNRFPHDRYPFLQCTCESMLCIPWYKESPGINHECL